MVTETKIKDLTQLKIGYYYKATMNSYSNEFDFYDENEGVRIKGLPSPLYFMFLGEINKVELSFLDVVAHNIYVLVGEQKGYLQIISEDPDKELSDTPDEIYLLSYEQ